MQSLTLRVILRAVFGYEPGAEEEDLRRRLRAMLEPLARPRAMMLLAALPFIRGDQAAVTARFEAARKAVDEVLYAEIARRRADPDALDQRDDIFSALLLAEDEDGERLSDREVRDELVTLLLAGHETTATGLAWSFDLLLHDAGRARPRAPGRRALSRRRGQGVAPPAAGDPGRRARGARRAVPPERLRGPARGRDQPLDPHRSTAARTCTRTPARSGPSASSSRTRPTPTPGSRSAAAPAAAWARASR